MRHSSLSSALVWLVALAAISCGDSAGDTNGSNTAASAGTTAAPASTNAGQTAASPPAADPGPNKPNTTNNPPAAGRTASPTPAAGAPAATSGGSSAPSAQAGSSAAAGAPAAVGGKGAAGAASPPAQGALTLFFLDNVSARVIRANADGSMRKAIVSGQGSGADGVAVDVAHGHVFWTNMGIPNADDGTIMRADLEGKNVATVVPKGTFTPKQLKFEPTQNKLYWSDREGMRVMRANADGTQLETLIVTGTTDADRRDASRWCVGIAVDAAGGKLYWTQKGGDNAGVGTIKRANLELPAGADPAKRDDIEVLFKNLPEPIDLDLDLEHRFLYWTDRGDNTVSRASLDAPAGMMERKTLVKGLSEAIGITLDVPRNRMYYTSLNGAVGAAALDGSDAKNLITGQGTLTGIAVVDLP